MFSQASIILFTGGVWQTPPRADTPLPRQTPPWEDTPSPADGYCSGRYASYWNAFLLTIVLVLQQVIAVVCEIIQNTCLHLAGLYFVFKLFE